MVEGCSHVRQHVSGCLPEKSGGHQIARNELFSHIHMSVVREVGNDTSSRYLPGHLNVLADHLSRRGQILKTEWSLNQTVADRFFRAWGRPFVDLFALEEHKIGNIHLTHSGGGVLESGQSCPELGRPVCVCIPSDKPDKGLSNQGQNRKRRDRPDSSRLAQPGVVSGPIKSHDRLSNNSSTSAETAQADLLTPLSSASVESQPSRYRGYQGIPQGERIF